MTNPTIFTEILARERRLKETAAIHALIDAEVELEKLKIDNVNPDPLSEAIGDIIYGKNSLIAPEFTDIKIRTRRSMIQLIARLEYAAGVMRDDISDGDYQPE